MWNLVDPNDSDSKQKKMLQLGVYQVVWVCEHVPKIDTNLDYGRRFCVALFTVTTKV
jgi:hypothetical protein